MRSFGTVSVVGVEGTGSYGAGLTRHLMSAGVRVVEVDRSDRQERHRSGKSDPLDAESAARAALSGKAKGEQRGRDGTVEAIRALMVVKRSARGERTRSINQARALVVTGPDDLRARFEGHRTDTLVVEAALRPRPGDVVGYATRIALRELARRAEFLGDQIDHLDSLLLPLVELRAPSLLDMYGTGPHVAAILIIAAGDHPDRLRSEAAWAHLCGACPIPAGSGKTSGRFRLNPGGDRQANHALWRIVFTRMGHHLPTQAYVERRMKQGKTKPEIIRCLKRYVAREVYHHLLANAD